MSDVTLIRIKCGGCGYEADSYMRMDGARVRLPIDLPADVLRRASATTRCLRCNAQLALFELGAVPS